MRNSIAAAAALAAGIAIAAPVAYSQGTPQNGPAPPQQQAAPQQSTPAPNAGGMMGEHGMMGMMGGWRHHHHDDDDMEGMEHHGWRHGWKHHGSPEQRCEDHVARRAGMIAYTIAKLDLNQQQQQIWDHLRGILEEGGRHEQQLCKSLGSVHASGTILDKVDLRQQFLNTKLQMLQQARPVLQQFYQSLNPEQKNIINHPFRR